MQIFNKLSARQVAGLPAGFHSDGGNLYIRVKESGARSWVFRYRAEGKVREIGLGPVHARSLAQAREIAAKMRNALLDSADPAGVLAHRPKSTASSFKAVATDLIEAKTAGWTNQKHAWQWTNSLEKFVYPKIGALDVSVVDTDQVLDVLKAIWADKHETATRVRQRIEAVLDAAKARKLRIGENPARWKGHLDKLLAAILKSQRVEHHPAMPWQELPAFIAQLQARDAVAARALEFLILNANRTGEVIGAQWCEINLDSGLWLIPAPRMKTKREHRVPLSKRSLEILASLKGLDDEFVFPGGQIKRPISNQAMNALMDRMKCTDVSVHGFRSTFRDWVSEATNFNPELAEMALAHTISNKVEAAYRRGDLLEKRKELMKAWAEYALSAVGRSLKKLTSSG
ncbi:Integrase family protein [Thiomonas sp. X19]|uniref:tyrosine-type recombinase/integrase n=1 Tax=Thiomonas sp. X19 TaxID=1050370 RepID=UPI000B7075E8|nr:site-specific integrase [Thiomonas sp. X19]SCC93495.1 Integrase family protein [Thiomonas sp. X19]